jgi:hypothetical protein
MQKFFQLLTNLKHHNSALWNGTAGGSMVFVETSVPQNVLAFTRERDNNQVLAVFNLSANPVETNLQLSQAGEYQEYFSGETKKLDNGTAIKLDKWGYQVFIKK